MRFDLRLARHCVVTKILSLKSQHKTRQ